MPDNKPYPEVVPTPSLLRALTVFSLGPILFGTLLLWLVTWPFAYVHARMDLWIHTTEWPGDAFERRAR